LNTNLNGQATGGGTIADRPRNPAVRRDHAGADGRRTAGQPPGPAALDDDLVQSGSRLCAAAVDDIRAIERETNLPASIVSGFQGAAQVFQDSLKGRGVVVLAAVFASPTDLARAAAEAQLEFARIGREKQLLLEVLMSDALALLGSLLRYGAHRENARTGLPQHLDAIDQRCWSVGRRDRAQG